MSAYIAYIILSVSTIVHRHITYMLVHKCLLAYWYRACRWFVKKLVFCGTKLRGGWKNTGKLNHRCCTSDLLSTGHWLAYLYISSSFLYSRKCQKNWLHPIECLILFCVMILKMFPAAAVTEHYILPNFDFIILNTSQNIVIVEYRTKQGWVLCSATFCAF